MAFGVVEEVAEDAGQECVVAVDGERFGGSVDGQGEVGWGRPPAGLVADEVGEVKGRAEGRVGVSGVEPGEKEQVRGEALQAQGVVVGGVDDAGPVGGAGVVQGEFEFRAEAGQWGAQFVGGVRGELTLLFDSRLQAVEGRVHGVGEPGDLAPRAGYGDAPVEVVGAEFREVGPDGFHGTQDPPGHQPGAARDDEREPEGTCGQLPDDGVEMGLFGA